MSLTTRAGLVASLAAWLTNRTDLATVSLDFIALAEAQIDAKIRHPLLTVQNTAFALDGELTDLPTGFRGMVSVAMASARLPLEYAPLDEMHKQRLTRTGAPGLYSILGEQLQIFPAPDDGDLCAIVYQGTFTRLTADASTNWVLERFPNAYLYGALLQAAPYLDEDSRVPVWERAFADAISDINAAGRREAQGVGLTVRSGGPTP